MNIMIVEDDSRVRTMIRRIVGDLATSVHECSAGEEAVKTYSRIHPDVVLMDVLLDGMDGLAATRAIHGADPAARIIIVTSYDEQDVRDSAREAGACGYVIKDNLLELRRLIIEQPSTSSNQSGSQWPVVGGQ